MKITNILSVIDGILLNGDKNLLIDNFSIDSRTITNDDIFIAIKGDKFDGNKFVIDVLESNAKGVIYDEDIDIDINKYKDKIIIKVKDSIKALQSLASYKRSLYNIPVVAITGSVGKTSTKDIIANVMSKKYNVLKTEGNQNNHIGLPLTLLKLKNHDAMCIEMGMNHFKEISLLTNILKPTIAVITNIGTAHIGNLGSRENILKAKLEILEGLDNNKKVVINNDNDLLHDWYIKEKENYNITTYGIENESEYQPYDINYNVDSSTFKIKLDEKEYEFFVHIPGSHFILNSLCALGIGKLLDIRNEDIIDGIKDFKLSKNRLENIKLDNNITLISDCYNANYDSMKASIEILGKHNGRKIAVLGDMLELGDYAEELHKKIGKIVELNKIDILICVGSLSKYIYNNCNINCKYMCKDNYETVELLKVIIKTNDTVLFKASNSMNFIDIVNKIAIILKK